MLSRGTIVSLNKDDACITLMSRAEVIHVPTERGDAWGFRDLDTGRELYTLETWTARVLPKETTQP